MRREGDRARPGGRVALPLGARDLDDPHLPGRVEERPKAGPHRAERDRRGPGPLEVDGPAEPLHGGAAGLQAAELEEDGAQEVLAGVQAHVGVPGGSSRSRPPPSPRPTVVERRWALGGRAGASRSPRSFGPRRPGTRLRRVPAGSRGHRVDPLPWGRRTCGRARPRPGARDDPGPERPFVGRRHVREVGELGHGGTRARPDTYRLAEVVPALASGCPGGSEPRVRVGAVPAGSRWKCAPDRPGASRTVRAGLVPRPRGAGEPI